MSESAQPERTGPINLTGEQLSVLTHIAVGNDYGDIAKKLGLADGHIMKIIKELFDIFGVNRRDALVDKAIKHGFFSRQSQEPQTGTAS